MRVNGEARGVGGLLFQRGVCVGVLSRFGMVGPMEGLWLVS
jgi:hypothetical protein